MFKFSKLSVLIIFSVFLFGQNILGNIWVFSNEISNQSTSQSQSNLSQSNSQQNSQNLEENKANLDYQNIDLAPVDNVKLRQNVAEMGQAHAESGSGLPKYEKVVDIKTCTKKQVY